MLQGHAQLDLLRKGKVVHREEHKNTITPFFTDCFNKSNISLMADRNKMLPLANNWFGGCLLTDKDNDTSISMIAGDSEIIAQASNTAYTGLNLKKGSYNSNESHDITDASGAVIGRTQVFDWSTSQGNGDIKSVCMTRPSIGYCDLYTDGIIRDSSAGIAETFANRVALEGITYNDVTYVPGQFQILDFNRERGYILSYDSSKVNIREFAINGFTYHITGRVLRNHIALHELAINASGGTEYANCSYTGDYIYVFKAVHSGNNTVVTDWKISTSDWSFTSTTHTYENVRLVGSNNNIFPKDVFIIKDDYIYTYGFALVNGSWIAKTVKASLTNDADVSLMDCPTYLNGSYNLSTLRNVNGPSLLLPNGDFIKFGTYFDPNPSYAGYYHNGTMYRSSAPYYDVWGHREYGINGSKGLHLAAVGGDNNVVSLISVFPYVSTVSNLSQKVEKRSDLTMKLTYTLTEV